MSLSDYVRILGRGPGRSRSMTQQEAIEAMTLMLEGAAPEAVGALLMLLRMKGETADEIAGLAKAAQEAMPVLEGVDLDWPCYAAGRTRGLPWFLLSAKLVAQSGRRVLIHGWNGADAQVRDGLSEAGIAVAAGAVEARSILARDGIVYLPLETAHPDLFALLALREKLGLRSCINTVCRMLNPGRAKASVQGVFHPSYRLLQADAAERLGWASLSVIKGGGGEFERNPAKAIEAFGLRDGGLWQDTLPPSIDETRRLSESGDITLAGLWEGVEAPFEEAIVLGTAELALTTAGDPEATATVRALWEARRKQPAA